MVQRYDVWCIEDIFKNSHDGSYVRYEDYKELEAELRRLAKLVVDSPCDWKTDELAREILDL